jgi:excisionase family DNA binding protein
MLAHKAERRQRNRRANPVPPAERLALDVQSAADMLSTSRRHLYDLIAEGRLASTKIGLRRVIPRSEIERLLAEGTR